MSKYQKILNQTFLGSVAENFWTGGDSQVSYVPWSFPSRVQGQLVSFEWWCRGFVGIPFADICLAVRVQKIRPIYTSWHSMKSSFDYPILFMRWSKFHQGLFVPVEGLVQSPLVTLRIQESFLFAAFLYLGLTCFWWFNGPNDDVLWCWRFCCRKLGHWSSVFFFQIKKCGSSLKKSIMCSCHLFRKTQVIPIQRIGFILIGNLAAILLALMYRAMSKWKFRACLYLILVYIYLYTVYIFRSL